MAPSVPPSLKKIKVFLARAEELDRDKNNPESRVVAYNCRQYAVLTGIPLAGATDNAAKTCLSELLGQLEKEKGSMQLAEAIKLKKTMQAFSQSAQSSNIELGSLVKTNKSWYYISISAGEVSLDGIPCICISPVSPLGATMIGLSAGDSFTFNKQKAIIVEVH